MRGVRDKPRVAATEPAAFVCRYIDGDQRIASGTARLGDDGIMQKRLAPCEPLRHFAQPIIPMTD
ncbi:hypothetical protein [Burkholderia stabilis]|uniref:Uncharacterized protein n=1 Tax=Burkholderia stabilis TaxID=95485 RepID=A0AAJ5N8Q4_9BURK|nr:hypothetical protein [Burkholderia stabilis]VBB13887.1 hypothetical protein BSTAB16_4073 [Burkholderia stabilis]